MTSSWLLPRVVELAATYLVQSTLFLIGGWALLPVLAARSRWMNPKPVGHLSPPGQSSPALNERIWKLSAVLALVTAPLSTFTGWSHPAWEWSWREQPSPTVAIALSETTDHEAVVTLDPPVVVPGRAVRRTQPTPIDENTTPQVGIADKPSTASVAIPSMAHAQDRSFDQRADANHADIEPATIVPMEVDVESVPLQATVTKPPYSGIDWLGLSLVVWFALSAARLVIKSLSLNRCLAACKPIDGELRRELNRLVPSGCTIRLLSAPVPHIDEGFLGVSPLDPPLSGVASAPRFFEANDAPSPPNRGADATPLRRQVTEPFACGLFRWTIVLPAEIEQELSTAELKALLAHEVAHLVRRDPWWLLLAEVLCSCLAFQPLNALARRRWQQAAELLCDDWAVERHVSATSLASCLTRIAERRLNRRVTAMGLAAVGRLGLLTLRIEWLLRPERAAEPSRHRGRMLATLLTFAAGLMVGMYGPRLSFVVSVEAGEDVEAIAVWDEIHRDLDETLNELSQIDSHLAGNPETAALASRLRVRAALLKLRCATGLQVRQ